MGRDGAGPGSVPDYGSDQSSPGKSIGRRSTDTVPAMNANKRVQAGSEVGKARLDTEPEDPQRITSGTEVVQAGKVKGAGEDVIDPDATEGRKGYPLGNSVNFITGEGMPPVEKATDNISE